MLGQRLATYGLAQPFPGPDIGAGFRTVVLAVIAMISPETSPAHASGTVSAKVPTCFRIVDESACVKC